MSYAAHLWGVGGGGALEGPFLPPPLQQLAGWGLSLQLPLFQPPLGLSWGSPAPQAAREAGAGPGAPERRRERSQSRWRAGGSGGGAAMARPLGPER